MHQIDPEFRVAARSESPSSGEEGGGGALPAGDPASGGAPGLPAALLRRIEESRRALLDAVGSPPDLTFVRSVGNLGDELIFAATRRLLPDAGAREIGLDEIADARGHTAVLSGGGAWCWPHHELLPPALEALEERFERVIVFPSSFDVSVPVVERALRKSRAEVFAREPESFRQIRPLCDARLAMDAAFFFDYSPYACEPDGTLFAYRTDRESLLGPPHPEGNRDVSVSCRSLDEWLRTIARHRTIHTDRAHVMIAAALLGREVAYRPNGYHKVASLAAWALPEMPVRAEAPGSDRAPVGIADPDAAEESFRHSLLEFARSRPSRGGSSAHDPLRLTIVLVTRDRPERAEGAIASIRRHAAVPHRLLVFDNGSRDDVRESLERLVTREPNADFVGWESNLGCAGGRAAAIERTTTEYLFFLDDDAEIFPGTLEALIGDLDSHPDALAVSARVVLPQGKIQHCGGNIRDVDGALRFGPLAAGLPYDAPVAPGPCDWIPGTGFLARREAFAQYPLDLGMGAYYEDNEWCYRAGRGRPGVFRCCPDAVVLHHQIPKDRTGHGRDEIARATGFVEAIARFQARHGRILDAIYGWAPELESAPRERRLAAARHLLDLVLHRGTDWVASQWAEGRLALLFSGDLAEATDADETARALDWELHRIRTSRWWKAANVYWKATDLLRRRRKSRP